MDPILIRLERDAWSVVGDDWYQMLDTTLVENFGKYRKYDGRSVRDLLRVLRNKVRLSYHSNHIFLISTDSFCLLTSFFLLLFVSIETPLPRPSSRRPMQPRSNTRRVS